MRPLTLAFGLGLLCLTACHHRPPPGLASLAAAGQIQQNAPLKVELQITINAPPAKVWALLTNIQNWPNWHRAITGTSVGAVQNGAPFSWSTTGMTIHSVIRLFVPDRQVAWTGDLLNMHAIHVWTFSPTQTGGTLVTVNESVSGFLIQYFYSAQDLQQSDQEWLQDLKTAAEAP